MDLQLTLSWTSITYKDYKGFEDRPISLLLIRLSRFITQYLPEHLEPNQIHNLTRVNYQDNRDISCTNQAEVSSNIGGFIFQQSTLKCSEAKFVKGNL